MEEGQGEGTSYLNLEALIMSLIRLSTNFHVSLNPSDASLNM